MMGNLFQCIRRCAIVSLLLQGLADSSGRFSRGGLVSLRKPASISSLFIAASVASKANDGSRSGNWLDGNGCACTADNAYSDSWWSVDLGADYRVMAVQLWNRADCCSHRLTYFDVVVTSVAPPPPIIDDTTLCFHHGGDFIPANVGFYKTCDRGIIGRHLTISKRNVSTEHLTLCEVEVFGLPISGATPAPSYSETKLTDGVLHCALICSSNAKTCQEFDYNKATRECKMHHDTLTINPAEEKGSKSFSWVKLPLS